MATHTQSERVLQYCTLGFQKPPRNFECELIVKLFVVSYKPLFENWGNVALLTVSAPCGRLFNTRP